MGRKELRRADMACPCGGFSGRQVSLATVAALVRDDEAVPLEGGGWYFCKEPECDVVYFSDDGRLIDKASLKTRVGVKENEAPRPVCYCFGHTVESIREEIERTGRSSVVAEVAAKVKAGDCACETLNPEGICCLADLGRAVNEATAQAGDRGPK